MRYHYKKPEIYSSMYGTIYICNHPVYNRCTLYKIGNLGLAVIQQRYNPKSKRTWRGEIDPWLTDLIYLHNGFEKYFHDRAREIQNGLYPTVSIQQIMWVLKIKLIPRERWETCFDRREV